MVPGYHSLGSWLCKTGLRACSKLRSRDHQQAVICPLMLAAPKYFRAKAETPLARSAARIGKTGTEALFDDHPSLKLGEEPNDVVAQAAHRGHRVNVLRVADELHTGH